MWGLRGGDLGVGGGVAQEHWGCRDQPGTFCSDLTGSLPAVRPQACRLCVEEAGEEPVKV